MIVVDASVALAAFLNEPHSAWCMKQLTQHSSELIMSTVNLSEVLMILQDQYPDDWTENYAIFRRSPVSFFPVTVDHAELAASARTQYPLNLGDCFAYALAKSEMCPILALDSDFLKTDLEVIHPTR